MRVDGDTLINRGNKIVTWNGQDGGLEGLRQKGWSVVNLLVIRRESMNRNTRTTLLAQGDNQVICGKYKVQKTRNEPELVEAIGGIIRENQNIMRAIEGGTQKLGLIINRDETLQSADFLVYGKVPIYRGSIRGLETKRWSRVTCVTNDQLPTLANTMSSISSNALTVAHFANSPLNAMIHYNFLGNFGRIILEIHNPAIKSQIKYKIKHPQKLLSKEYKALAYGSRPMPWWSLRNVFNPISHQRISGSIDGKPVLLVYNISSRTRLGKETRYSDRSSCVLFFDDRGI
uniref:RdRp catalytic domain-containing protein n=1 Tax=Timema tahoe TaxID=61484 RepID=A0A7R9ITL4_9NEOP|nr:unnamed protein product [Timema tahoe]